MKKKKIFLSIIVASLHNYSFGRKAKINFYFPPSLIIIVIASLFLVTNFVFAQVTIPPFGPTSWPDLFEKITNVVSGVIGSIAGIMLIIAGILYLVSAGDPNRLTLAKQCLTYAIIGIIIAISAKTIVDSVLWIIGAP